MDSYQGAYSYPEAYPYFPWDPLGRPYADSSYHQVARHLGDLLGALGLAFFPYPLTGDPWLRGELLLSIKSTSKTLYLPALFFGAFGVRFFFFGFDSGSALIESFIRFVIG